MHSGLWTRKYMLYIDAVIFTIAAMLIALVKPYKKTCTNAIDAFLLAFLALLSSMVSTVAGAVVLLQILIPSPAAVFAVLVVMRITNRMVQVTKYSCLLL